MAFNGPPSPSNYEELNACLNDISSGLARLNQEISYEISASAHHPEPLEMRPSYTEQGIAKLTAYIERANSLTNALSTLWAAPGLKAMLQEEQYTTQCSTIAATVNSLTPFLLGAQKTITEQETDRVTFPDTLREISTVLESIDSLAGGPDISLFLKAEKSDTDIATTGFPGINSPVDRHHMGATNELEPAPFDAPDLFIKNMFGDNKESAPTGQGAEKIESDYSLQEIIQLIKDIGVLEAADADSHQITHARAVANTAFLSAPEEFQPTILQLLEMEGVEWSPPQTTAPSPLVGQATSTGVGVNGSHPAEADITTR